MLDKLKALDDAGEKATSDDWYVVGQPWNDHSPFINSISPDPHVGRALLDTMDFDGLEAETDEELDRMYDELMAEDRANCEFVCQAANTRPTISALVKKLEGVDVEELREALDYADNWRHETDDDYERVVIDSIMQAAKTLLEIIEGE